MNSPRLSPMIPVLDLKSMFQEYVEKGVDPLVFRDGSDPERQKHGLGQIGHFTAMVWAKTTKLGCGKSSGGGVPLRSLKSRNLSALF